MDWDVDGSFQDFCAFHNITIQVESNIGSTVRGFCYYKRGRYTVFLNNRFNIVQMRKTLIHELIHVFENHFECPKKDIHKCEKEVHVIIEKLQLGFSY